MQNLEKLKYRYFTTKTIIPTSNSLVSTTGQQKVTEIQSESDEFGIRISSHSNWRLGKVKGNNNT